SAEPAGEPLHSKAAPARPTTPPITYCTAFRIGLSFAVPCQDTRNDGFQILRIQILPLDFDVPVQHHRRRGLDFYPLAQLAARLERFSRFPAGESGFERLRIEPHFLDQHLTDDLVEHVQPVLVDRAE